MTPSAKSKRVVRALLLALLPLLLGACAPPTAVRDLRETPPSGLPTRVELTAVPFFPQQAYQCGPAALATVLAQRGLALTPEALSKEVYLPARHGSLQEELLAATRRHGLLAYPLTGGLRALIVELAAGNPVLVLQNLGLGWYPEWHYAVAVGYDLDAGILTLRSGPYRTHRNSLALFERTWARAGHWAMLALPPGQLPASATALPLLRAAWALEQAGQSGAARATYRAATIRWPGEAAAWFALGNRFYADAKPRQAAVAFGHALTLTPADPKTWNNYAYALRARGCPQEAQAAIACALAIQPDSAGWRASAAELAKPADETGANCPRIQCPASGEKHRSPLP